MLPLGNVASPGVRKPKRMRGKRAGKSHRRRSSALRSVDGDVEAREGLVATGHPLLSAEAIEVLLEAPLSCQIKAILTIQAIGTDFLDDAEWSRWMMLNMPMIVKKEGLWAKAPAFTPNSCGM